MQLIKLNCEKNNTNGVLQKTDGFVRRPLLFAALLNIFILLITAVFVPLRGFTDDYLISLMLTSSRGIGSPYVLVLNALISYPLYWLQTLVPYWNVFNILQLFVVCVCFTILSYLLLQKEPRNRWGGMLAIGLPILVSPGFYILFQYTSTALLACFTGGLLLCEGVKKTLRRKWIVVGIGLFLIGYLLRSAGIASAAFCAIGMIVHWWSYRMQPYKKIALSILKEIIPFFILGVLLLGSNIANTYLYNLWDGYDEYRAYNKARATCVDYAHYEYDEIRTELEDIGVSENDYYMLYHDIMYEVELFDIETLAQIAALQPKSTLSNSEKIERFFSDYLFWMCKPQFRTYSLSHTLYVFYSIMALLALIFSANKASRYRVGAVFVLLNAIAFAIIYGGRFPFWVQEGLYAAAIYTTAFITEWGFPQLITKKFTKKTSQKTKNNYGAAIFLITIFCLLPIAQPFATNNWKKPYYETSGQSLLEYTQSKPEDIFVIDNIAKMPFAFMKSNGSFRATKPGSWKNVIRVVDWYIEHSVSISQLEELQISSPIRAIEQPNTKLVTQLINNKYCQNAPVYATYLYEHTGISYQYACVKFLDGLALYQYTANFSDIAQEPTHGLLFIKAEKMGVEEMYEVTAQFKQVYKSFAPDARFYLELTHVPTQQVLTFAMGDLEQVSSSQQAVTTYLPIEQIFIAEEYTARILVSENNLVRTVHSSDINLSFTD